MSGPLAVPLTIAAVFVSSNTAKALLGITAVVCFWGAAYGVWVRERRERNALEAKLAAHAFGLAFSFGSSLDLQNNDNALEIRTYVKNTTDLSISWRLEKLSIIILGVTVNTFKSGGPYIINRGDTTTLFPGGGLSIKTYQSLERITQGTLEYDVHYGPAGGPITRHAYGEIGLDIFKDQSTGTINVNWRIISQIDQPIS